MSLGQARRTVYAARRPVRARWEPLPVYRIDEAGQAHEAGTLSPLQPSGSAVHWHEPCPWPLDVSMRDGWFDGLPYLLDDLRPQGFLGRQMARAHAGLIQVPVDPTQWSEDDVLHALSLLGSDMPGCYVVGDVALRAWLERAGQFHHVLVKFSGVDDSAGTRRWSDLLVCEHLAAQAMTEHLGVAVVTSEVLQAGGRTFLEVTRFDRQGLRGRLPVYDMLPMQYAPPRAAEVVTPPLVPSLPLPAERASWAAALPAARAFWAMSAEDARISDDFRRVCAANAQKLGQLAG